MIYESGDWLLGEDFHVLKRICWNGGLDRCRLTPKELRAKFHQMGPDAVFVFQLRNPIYNPHALLMTDTHRQLKEKGFKRPVLLLHPLGGWTKDDDVPLDTRMFQHQAVLDVEKSNMVLAIFLSPMMYADRQKQFLQRHPWQACSKNGALEIVPFRVVAHDKSAKRIDFFQLSRAQDFGFISGTKMRILARIGENPPDGFMASSAWKVLDNYYQSLKKQSGRN